ncbi:hypothetical protein TDB9533_03840 [Thalassocella blandensis]|nr:hypothetical protein TDB9533_03840 [Thalassocella blandensis]
MSENEVSKTDDQMTNLAGVREVPCMLLPMLDHILLLPNTTVAEMSPMKPLMSLPDTPEWMMGLYEWRNIHVPVVSLESLNKGGRPPMNPQGRIAVLNSTGVSDKVAFIGIHTQGIPRMSRVGEEDIIENTETTKREFDLMAVKVGMEEFFMPDVVRIQAAVADLNLSY